MARFTDLCAAESEIRASRFEGEMSARRCANDQLINRRCGNAAPTSRRAYNNQTCCGTSMRSSNNHIPSGPFWCRGAPGGFPLSAEMRPCCVPTSEPNCRPGGFHSSRACRRITSRGPTFAGISTVKTPGERASCHAPGREKVEHANLRQNDACACTAGTIVA